MPEVFAYASSVHSQTSWTNPTNALGAPNDVFATSSVTSAVIRFLFANLAALPDTAVINRVLYGVRFSGSVSTTGCTISMLVGASTVVDGSYIQNPGTQLVGITHNYELDRPGTAFTAATLKAADLRLQATKGGSSGTGSIDAAWVRVVYDEPETTTYASVVVSGTNWSSTANLTGAPNAGTAASVALGAVTSLRMSAHTGIPVDAVLDQVVMGARIRCVAAGSVDLQLSTAVGTVDTAVKTYTAADSTWQTLEYQLDPTKVTLSALQSTDLRITVTNRSSEVQLDAVWARAHQKLAVVSRAKRWSGSAWIDAPIKRWSGTAWVDTTIKRWSGSAWV